MGKAKENVETAGYIPQVPEWFSESDKKSQLSAYEQGFETAKAKFKQDFLVKLLGGKYEAENYRTLVKFSVWAVTLIPAIALVVALGYGSVFGLIKLHHYLFPADPNAVVAIQAPESLAKAMYESDRKRQDTGGFFSINPWQPWEQIDEQTRNIYRKKAIARTEGKPEGEPGQVPPETK